MFRRRFEVPFPYPVPATHGASLIGGIVALVFSGWILFTLSRTESAREARTHQSAPHPGRRFRRSHYGRPRWHGRTATTPAGAEGK